MAEVFTIDADLRQYIDEMDAADRVNKRFQKSTIELSTSLTKNAQGLLTLERRLSALNNQGEKVVVVQKKMASSQNELRNATQKQIKTTQILSKEEKARLADLKSTQRILANLAKQRSREAAVDQRAAQVARELRQKQERFGAQNQRAINLERKRAQQHAQALKENIALDRRRLIAKQNIIKSTTREAQALQRSTSATRRNTAALRTASTAIAKQSKLAKDLTITWRSFFRLIALRIAAGAIFRLTSLLREGTTEAIEFSRKIAEVQTIIRSSEQSIVAQQRITRRIIDISARNNFELADTTEAFYDSLSNQVSDSLDGITNFTTSAIRLAKASVSSLEDSANSIVSVVQAFDLSFVQAENVAADLFNLVDRGRLRLNELANTLGNVAVPARVAGVSFRELFATLANLTLQGISVNRSQTLLRNLFLKMVSPTEKLKLLYREWGVETGKSANETFNLIGVFQKLNIEAEKSATFIGEVFGRIRARLAANASITGDSIEEIIDALDEITNGAERFNKAVQLVRESAGENVQKELRQFKIALFELIGLNVLEFLDKFDKEAADLSDTLAKLAIAATAAVAAMATIAAALAVFFFAGPIGITIILSTLAIGIASAAASFALLSESGAQAFAKLRKESDLLADEIREKVIVAVAKLDRELRAMNVDVFRSARVLAAEERRELFAIQDLLELRIEKDLLKLETEERYLDLLVNSKAVLTDNNDEIIRTNSFLQKNLDIQTAIGDEAFRALQISRQRATELGKSFESARFERFIRNADALAQIQARVGRAGSLRRRAINLFNIGNIDEARSAIDEAVNQLSRADQEFFQGTGINKFEKAFRQLEATAFAIERRTQEVQKNLGNTADNEAKALTAEMKENSDALELQQKLIKDTKDILEEVGRVTNSNLLTESAKNEIIGVQADLLNEILGREFAIGESIKEQLRIKLRLAELAEDDRKLKDIEQQQEDAVSAQSTALQEQGANFGIFQTQIIRTVDGLKELREELEKRRVFAVIAGGIEKSKNIKIIDDLLIDLNRIIEESEPLAITAAIKEPSAKDIRNIKKDFEPLKKELQKFIPTIGFDFDANLQDVISEILKDQIEINKVLDVQEDLDQTAIDKNKELQIILEGILELKKEIAEKTKEAGTSTEAILDPLNEETNTFRENVKSAKEEGKLIIDRLTAARKQVILAGQNEELRKKVLKDTNNIVKAETEITDQVKSRSEFLFEQSKQRTRDRGRPDRTRKTPLAQQGLTVDGDFITREELQKVNEIDFEPAKEQLDELTEAERRAKEQGRLMIEETRRLNREINVSGEQLNIYSGELDLLQQQFFNDEFAIRFLIDALRDLRIELQTLPSVPTTAIGFAAGGFVPKGTDTIPAMLSPGEFVVNAQATLMNRSLLHIINRSSTPVKPQYLQQGGSVTLTNHNEFNLQSVSENVDVKRFGRKLETLQRRGILGKRRIYG